MNRPGSPEGPLGSVSDDEWAILWTRLRFHVRRKYPYLTRRHSVEGIVAQAILDTLSGHRRYPPIDKETGLEREDISLFVFLCWTIRSQVSHLNKQYKRIPPLSNLDEVENPLQIQNGSEPRQFQFKHVNIEGGVTYELFIAESLELVKDNPLLCQMVKLWSEDPELKPSDMADQLGLDIKDVRSAQKRLKRRLAKLRGGNDD